MDSNRTPTALHLLEKDFIPFRAQLLDLAAFLDRLERYEGGGTIRQDFRYGAIMTALELILSGKGSRVESILNTLSDPTTEPRADTAAPSRASGAWDHSGAD